MHWFEQKTETELYECCYFCIAIYPSNGQMYSIFSHITFHRKKKNYKIDFSWFHLQHFFYCSLLAWRTYFYSYVNDTFFSIKRTLFFIWCMTGVLGTHEKVILVTSLVHFLHSYSCRLHPFFAVSAEAFITFQSIETILKPIKLMQDVCVGMNYILRHCVLRPCHPQCFPDCLRSLVFKTYT